MTDNYCGFDDSYHHDDNYCDDDLISWSKSTILARSGRGANEINAAHIVLPVKPAKSIFHGHILPHFVILFRIKENHPVQNR